MTFSMKYLTGSVWEITINLDKIAQMSCNPAIGGLAKGHLVREIDALGGMMGLLADETGIQFRLLNRSRGGAVQAPRAQSDKALYRLTMRQKLENLSHLTLIQGTAADILIKNGKAQGILTTDGMRLKAKAVIITPGTFLNGLIHIGFHNYSAGRAEEPASKELSESLQRLGLRILRLKTGTPMRLHKNSIKWDHFKAQSGDAHPVPFSFRTKKRLENKIACHIGYTNPKTHEIINQNLDESPLYSGKIVGIGPRYCEGLDAEEIYVNGLSSSLPLPVQKKILESIPGLDEAKILRPAYGIEYDAIVPTQLYPTLETRLINNLYLAGQINGTSGYEEAAAQGLMAGINAVLKIKGRKPFLLRRDEAYIGVLIDDLITKGVEEPYRLFTSRAEYRLHLRVDNADQRLTKQGHSLGMIQEQDYKSFLRKQKRIHDVMDFLKTEKIRTAQNIKISLKDMLKKPNVTFQNVLEYKKPDVNLSEEEIRHVESEVKYEGYLKKQTKEIARTLRIDKEKIPDDIKIKDIPGLTREVKEKLEKYSPKTIEEAKRIPGVTPAAIMNLHIFINLRRKNKGKNVPRGTSQDNE
jgi:tRNA uridine 5-carboxymethylaminomethyl modification enzyme